MLIPQFWLGALAMLAAEMALFILTVCVAAIIRTCKAVAQEEREDQDGT